jgi:hypothetical protein
MRKKYEGLIKNENKIPGGRNKTYVSGRSSIQISFVQLIGLPLQNLNRKYKALVESSWNAMAHGDARKGKWRGNWQMEWLDSTLHTTSEHGVSSITVADAHTSAASSRLNWRPCRFKWTRPFRRKTKSGFCACANTFQTQSTHRHCRHTEMVNQLFLYWLLAGLFSKFCTAQFGISLYRTNSAKSGFV